MQRNEYFEHQYVKTHFTTNHFPELPFYGTHKKPHGVHGLSKHYHMHFDPKIGHGTCEINYTHCAYTQCKYTIEKPGLQV